VRKLLIATMCVAALCAVGCSGDDDAEPTATVASRASSASYLFTEPNAAALVEWTANDGDVIGNITVAHVNTAGMNVEQAVAPITGFVTSDGDVGLEYGKGDAAVNLTGRLESDTLALAGPFGLADRTQYEFTEADVGDWEAAIAVLDEAVEAAYNAEVAAAAAAEDEEEWVDPADPEVGDPYVDYDAENRRFDREISNIDTLTATAQSSVAEVDAAAAVSPMDSMQLSQVGAAVSTVEIAAADARSALTRLERHYTELQGLLLDEALKPFTARLDAARATAAAADRAVGRAQAIYDDAASRVQD
jgi:hypothetical protein